MRLPRPRFTMRRLMVVIAIASGLLGVTAEAVKLLGKKAAYRSRAAMHAVEARALTANFHRIYLARKSYEKRVDERREEADPRGYLDLGRRIPANRMMLLKFDELRYSNLFRYEWHERMREKYETAARYPWRPVPPDPPQPE
jgi:hypothetical protein